MADQLQLALPFDVPQITKTGTCIFNRSLPDNSSEQVPVVVLIIEDATGDKRVTLSPEQARALGNDLNTRAGEVDAQAQLVLPPRPRLLLPGQ